MTRTYEVRIHNRMLGWTRFVGKPSQWTEEQARAYAVQQAARSQSFAEFAGR